jgi:bifunctional non-homologous end joining protein LigD
MHSPPFDQSNFVFELMHDGFRAVAYIEDGTCRLISRKQIQYKSFAGLCSAMATLPVKDAILDGEIVCLDSDGRPADSAIHSDLLCQDL